MYVIIIARNCREIFPGGLEIDDAATVRDLQEFIHQRYRQYDPSRQHLTTIVRPGANIRPLVLIPGNALQYYRDLDGNLGNLTLWFEDLGIQVSCRKLFFWQYLGPLVIYLIFYFYPAVYKFFGNKEERYIHPAQMCALWYWVFHYLKRILEAFYVLSFSRPTVSSSTVFRNCAYYWSFGTYIAYFVNHPLYTPMNYFQILFGYGLGIFGHFVSIFGHWIMSNLRDRIEEGGNQFPHLVLLDYITRANRTAEIFQWLGFNIATQTVAGYVFLVVASLTKTT